MNESNGRIDEINEKREGSMEVAAPIIRSRPNSHFFSTAPEQCIIQFYQTTIRNYILNGGRL